jgi:hypothetical protein
MKIAVAVRTCGQVFHWWNDPDRIVNVSKPSLVLTSLNSLCRTIKNSKHDIILSIHDDNSGEQFLSSLDQLIKFYSIEYQLIQTEPKGNCISQYNWLKQQHCDYVYLMEDDYLHTEHGLDTMLNACEYMQEFEPNDLGGYAVFPMNHPHRYRKNFIYSSYIFIIDNRYWRSITHTSASFFISKKDFTTYDEYMRINAYSWSERVEEDKAINLFWNMGKVRLLCPINSLAWHIADKTHEDKINDWKSVWDQNFVEYKI